MPAMTSVTAPIAGPVFSACATEPGLASAGRADKEVRMSWRCPKAERLQADLQALLDRSDLALDPARKDDRCRTCGNRP